MEIFLLMMVVLTCVLGLSSIWLLVSRLSVSRKIRAVHRQLIAAESQLKQTKALLYQSEKKLAKNQEQHNIILSHQNEFLELKRENEQLKNEIKILNEDLRIKNHEYKRLESIHIDKLYALTNERNALLTQIKETKSNISKVITLQSKLQFAEQEIEKLTKEVQEARTACD